MTAGIPHAGPAAPQALAATTGEPPGSPAPELLLGISVGPLFVLTSLVGLTG